MFRAASYTARVMTGSLDRGLRLYLDEITITEYKTSLILPTFLISGLSGVAHVTILRSPFSYCYHNVLSTPLKASCSLRGIDRSVGSSKQCAESYTELFSLVALPHLATSLPS